MTTNYPNVCFAIARCRIFLPGIKTQPVYPRVLDALRSARITAIANQTECSPYLGVMAILLV